MGELLKQFYELWRAASHEVDHPVYVRAPKEISQAMSQLGMSLDQPDLGSRLEFLSPKRGSWSGVWIQELPEGLSGEAVQRVMAACFQGLVASAPLVLIFREGAQTAGLQAWLRQAGFEIRLEGRSGAMAALLAARLRGTAF